MRSTSKLPIRRQTELERLLSEERHGALSDHCRHPLLDEDVRKLEREGLTELERRQGAIKQG